MLPFRSVSKRERNGHLSLKVSPLPPSSETMHKKEHLTAKKTNHSKSKYLDDVEEGIVSKEEDELPLEWTGEALLPTLRLASCFGTLPVSMTRSRISDPISITYSFSWFSPKAFVTLFLLFCLITIEITALQYMVTGFYYSVRLETIEQTTAGAAFYGYSVISTILFLRLATSWRYLMNIWYRSEALLLLNKGESPRMRSLKTSHHNKAITMERGCIRKLTSTLRGRFAIITSIVLALAIGEHLWHVIVRVIESSNEVTVCQSISSTETIFESLNATVTVRQALINNKNKTNNKGISEFHDKLKVKCLETIYTNDVHFSLRVLENFSRRSHWFVYEQTSYAAWKGLAIVVISIVATFIWNFTDIFIMILSMALTTRFKQLNSKLQLTCGKDFYILQALTPKHWEGLRCQYASLSRLSRTLDDHINSIIFFSIASNLYFICIQLLSGLVTTTKRSVDKSAFYFYSFAFLVGRAAGVILLASSINQETLTLPKHLYLSPHHSYCKEMQRFMIELTTDFIALSGLNLFNITRNFLLGVAGAVVTYEIVLLQLETDNTNSN